MHKEKFKEILYKAVYKIPDTELIILLLLHEEKNLSYQKIAEILGYSTKEVKRKIFVARRLLRKILQKTFLKTKDS